MRVLSLGKHYIYIQCMWGGRGRSCALCCFIGAYRNSLSIYLWLCPKPTCAVFPLFIHIAAWTFSCAVATVSYHFLAHCHDSNWHQPYPETRVFSRFLHACLICILPYHIPTPLQGCWTCDQVYEAEHNSLAAPSNHQWDSNRRGR